MKPSLYIASYGNGTKRGFYAYSQNEATSLAYQYGVRNGCGALLTINRN